MKILKNLVLTPLAIFAAFSLLILVVACSNDTTEDNPTDTPIDKIQLSYSSGNIGDIVLADGKFVTAENFTASSSDYKNADGNPIGVIAFIGNGNIGVTGYVYMVGLKNKATQSWATVKNQISAIECTPSQSNTTIDVSAASSITFAGDKDGGDNWNAICSTDSFAQSNIASRYPAFHFAETYSTNGDTNLTGTSYSTNWYIPSIAELTLVMKNMATINTSITNAGGTILPSGFYWSSSKVTSSVNVWMTNGNGTRMYIGNQGVGSFTSEESGMGSGIYTGNVLVIRKISKTSSSTPSNTTGDTTTKDITSASDGTLDYSTLAGNTLVADVTSSSNSKLYIIFESDGKSGTIYSNSNGKQQDFNLVTNTNKTYQMGNNAPWRIRKIGSSFYMQQTFSLTGTPTVSNNFINGSFTGVIDGKTHNITFYAGGTGKIEVTTSSGSTTSVSISSYSYNESTGFVNATISGQTLPFYAYFTGSTLYQMAEFEFHLYSGEVNFN